MAVLGVQRLAERGTGNLNEGVLAKELVQYQTRIVAENDSETVLEGSKRLLDDLEQRINDLPQLSRDRYR